jgi:DNA-binding transcriptional ArsR family regulator
MNSMNQIFGALAHADRRRILDCVKAKPGCNIQEVCQHFTTSRIAVLKHIRILEAADLLVTEKVGRERHLFFNAVPIQRIYDRWTSEYSALWASKLTRLKYAVEGQADPAPKRRTRTPKKKRNTDG